MFSVQKNVYKLLLLWSTALLALPLISPLHAKEPRPFDLHQPLDPTNVGELPHWGQRLLQQTETPGLEDWRYWRIKEQHPATGEVISCKTRWSSQCQQFGSIEDYLRFRLAAYQQHDIRFFNYKQRQLPHHSQAQASMNSWQQAEVFSQPTPPQWQTAHETPWQEVNPQNNNSRINGGNQWSHPLQ